MVLESLGEVAEMFRNSFPFSFLFFIPIFILISPVSPVNAAHEFAAYRMQQYDIHGAHYGCRNALVNMEARPVDAKMITRRCIVSRLEEMTISKFKEFVQENAGAILIIVPNNMSQASEGEIKNLEVLEKELLVEETPIPVYFAHDTEKLSQIYSDLQDGGGGVDKEGSAVDALLNSATANGFQIVVNGPPSKEMPDFQITNIQGHLSGYGIEEQLKTIVLVAHYDAFGVAPSLAYGADSNGSGVLALLELARLFSKLYTNSRTHAKYNLVFLLSGGGKFNYQGTKRWIEDNIDSPDTSLLSDVAFVLCLDSIGTGDELNLHVSKPPKDDSQGAMLLKNLEDIIQIYHKGMKFDMVHKKINLAEDMLAWEHERFSIKRLPAFTLSHFPGHKGGRTTILDTRDNIDVKKLKRNIQIIAEALARHIYDLSSQGKITLFAEGLNVDEDAVSAWLDQMTRQPRAMQLLPKDNILLSTLETSLERHLKDVKKTTFKADKRDPDFMFYSGASYTMSAYSVKPAIFDLFLAVGILAYLGVVYLVVLKFHLIYGAIQKMSSPKRVKTH